MNRLFWFNQFCLYFISLVDSSNMYVQFWKYNYNNKNNYKLSRKIHEKCIALINLALTIKIGKTNDVH